MEANNDCTTEEEEDLFKVAFKRYKSSKFQTENIDSGGKLDPDGILLRPTSDLGDVVDWTQVLKQRCLNDSLDWSEEAASHGLRCPTTWKIFELDFPKGLIIIRNPFTKEGQRRWIRRSVIDFPQPPYLTNVHNLERKEGKKTNSSEFYKKLRWATFGYHHNWDTKVYSEESKCQFPTDLAQLTAFLAQVLDFQNFTAEAAIVNYYHLDSTLSGHVDRSEEYQNAPLFSLSFGASCIFLIGGRTKSINPQAIHLRSGDVVVMSQESRHAFHGVPKIFKTSYQPWNDSNSPISCKRIKLQEEDWNEFLYNYAENSRINLNIRQVLVPGQSKLSESTT